MKKLFYLCLLSAGSIVVNAQNVGIGTPTPTEKLDVNGNINLTGTIKANGTDGATGQVLMKNSSGNLAWGDFEQYKHVAGFQAGSFTQPATAYSWMVPAGVTQVLFELWGGGAGGAVGGGGGGGAYEAAELTVTPGTTINISVGGGGFGATTATGSGSNGNATTVTINVFQLTAYGGQGASVVQGGFGGDFNANSSIFFPFGQSGESGEPSSENYGQYNATNWFTAVKFGSGGNGGNSIHTNRNGGFQSYNTSNKSVYNLYYAMPGNKPGGGGGGQFNGGSYGAPGQVIIHY